MLSILRTCGDCSSELIRLGENCVDVGLALRVRWYLVLRCCCAVGHWVVENDEWSLRDVEDVLRARGLFGCSGAHCRMALSLVSLRQLVVLNDGLVL